VHGTEATEEQAKQVAGAVTSQGAAAEAKAGTTTEESSEPDTSGQDQSRRVNVIFSPEVYGVLQKLASSQGINVSDALRQAINISNLIVPATKEKNSRVLIDRGGKVQEIKLV